MLLHLNKKEAKSLLYAKVLALELFLKTDSIYKYCYPSNKLYDGNLKIDSKIQSILLDLNQNYHQRYCLEDLSKRHFMDKYYMCHLFKKETGFSILEYIQSRRILYAKSFN